MPVYKFYRISHEGRVAGPPIVSDADTDAAALKQVKHYVDGFDIEVWQEARIIAYLVPEKER